MDFGSCTGILIRSLEEFKKKLNSSLKDDQFSFKIAKDDQASETSKRAKSPSCFVGPKGMDQKIALYLTTHNLDHKNLVS